jgi:alpha/beta superfamily hydrolase
VPEASVAKLAHKLSTQRNIKVDYTLLPDANHTFTNTLDPLTQVIDDYLALLPLDQPMEAAAAVG